MNSQEYSALHSGSGVISRTKRALIAVKGEDRTEYLQGLLTNDIKGLSSYDGCYCLYLNSKGRLEADLFAFNLGNVLLLDVPSSVHRMMVTRLNEFIFAEDVQIEDWTDQWVSCGVFGPSSMQTVDAGLKILGINTESCSVIRELNLYKCLSMQFKKTELVVARTDEHGPLGFSILTERSFAETLSKALISAGAVGISDEAIDVVRIESGVPAFSVDMDSEIIPIEAGISERAISFTKGCYVGQEVIVRIMHRGEGRVAKRLVGLALGNETNSYQVPETLPARGATLWHDDKAVGKLTSVTWSPKLSQVVGLGYLPRLLTEIGTKVMVEVDGQRVGFVVTPTPFVVP